MEDIEIERILRLMPELKLRAKTLSELTENSKFLLNAPPEIEEGVLTEETKKVLNFLLPKLRKIEKGFWEDGQNLFSLIKSFSENSEFSLKIISRSLMAAIIGKKVWPPLSLVLSTLGKDICLARIKRAVDGK